MPPRPKGRMISNSPRRWWGWSMVPPGQRGSWEPPLSLLEGEALLNYLTGFSAGGARVSARWGLRLAFADAVGEAIPRMPGAMLSRIPCEMDEPATSTAKACEPARDGMLSRCFVRTSIPRAIREGMAPARCEVQSSA